MKKRDANNVIREALMKRLSFDDSTAHVVTGQSTKRFRFDSTTVHLVTRRAVEDGELIVRLSDGVAIRLVWTTTGRLAHRFDFTSPNEPIMYVELPAAAASMAELQSHFETLTPALTAELRAHAPEGHLTIAGGDREQPEAEHRQRFRDILRKSVALAALFILIIAAAHCGPPA